MVRDEYESLLRSWCDGMLSLQIKDPAHKRFHGGLMCPACQRIHGRSADAVYPLLYMADRTGEKKYLDGALALFDWGETVICESGSIYNDAQGQWEGITVFSAMSIFHALEYHSHLLSEDTKKRFEKRLQAMVQWVDATITPEFVTNINYHATAAALLAVTGAAWSNEGYLQHAAILAESCKRHMMDEGLFYGEGKPMEQITSRGCRPVDIGYNVEESIPSMLAYARCVDDKEMLHMLEHQLETHLEFMLPDGAWDNSTGTRNFKWTYWGSRTSDGCQTAYGCWNGEKPVWEEAARRNLALYRQCTDGGLLYGGPDYLAHGEEPCIHHTFCHAKALAEVLDFGIREPAEGLPPRLPSECAPPIRYFPGIDTYRIAAHGFLASVTGYDFEYLEGGHASGGTMTMLWHRKTGPILASSMTDYSMKEVFNMQLTRRKESHQALTPAVELYHNGTRYAQCYDYHAHIQAAGGENVEIITVADLVSVSQHSPERRISCRIRYTLGRGYVAFRIQLSGAWTSQCRFVLPLISRHAYGCTPMKNGLRIVSQKDSFLVKTTNEMQDPKPIFFLTPGLEAWSCHLMPDITGKIEVTLYIE